VTGRRSPRIALALAMALGLGLGTAGPARAQSGAKAEARELFFEAGEALNSGDFVKAAKLYREANDLYPAPTSLLGLARAYVQLGRLVEASEIYSQLAETRLAGDAVEAFARAVEDGKREGAELDKRIPRLTVTVDGPMPESVTIDGEPMTLSGPATTLRLDPGKREVQATHPDYEPFETTVSLAESTVSDVRIALVPLPKRVPDAPLPKEDPGLDALQISGIVLGSVGLAGLATWGVTGTLYLVDEGKVNDDCQANVCRSQDGVDAANRAKTLGVVNTVSLFAGLGLVAVGTTLFLLGGSEEETEPSVSLRLGTGVMLEGRF